MAVSSKALLDKLNTTCNKAILAGHRPVILANALQRRTRTLASEAARQPEQRPRVRPPPVRHRRPEGEEGTRTSARQLQDREQPARRLGEDILDAIREAWVFGSLEQGAHKVPLRRTCSLALLADRALGDRVSASSPELPRLRREARRPTWATCSRASPARRTSRRLPPPRSPAPAVRAASGGGPRRPRGGKTPALDQFTVNLTAKAKAGEIDPVVGRDHEIRQVIDILTRRRQNNPILTGEAGVGKTAVVEGLALRIVGGDVPEPLKNVQLHTLDLGLLQAGAGVKGEFENRLKWVIDEVKRSPMPIILFIDEAHTMIGAGGQAGQNDAANLLKPALARGELRTIAATTFAEYKKYFETDAALKRRFQQVKVDEPDEQKAIRMLRGLVADAGEAPQGPHSRRGRGRRGAALDALHARPPAARQGREPARHGLRPRRAESVRDAAGARRHRARDRAPQRSRSTSSNARAACRPATRSASPTSRARKDVAETRRGVLDEQLEKEKELVAKIRDKRDAIEKTGADATRRGRSRNSRSSTTNSPQCRARTRWSTRSSTAARSRRSSRA